jgi:hypothetical protein
VAVAGGVTDQQHGAQGAERPPGAFLSPLVSPANGDAQGDKLHAKE